MASAAALTAGGCTGGFGHCPEPPPVDGTPAEYAIAAGDYAGYRVGAPVACTTSLTVVPVTGLGTKPFATAGAGEGCGDAGVAPAECGPSEYVFLTDVATKLGATGVPHAEWAIGYCPAHDPLPISVPHVHVERWRDAAPAVEATGASLHDGSIAGTTYVGVGPRIVLCPL